ncbi:class I fructose-bisphosphate aldolase [Haloarcula salinisoli]|uniref:fructose-bisphosphate aldolase n=1 Tax=Haloarcula salinisoli TaxID=2487746 RepID=A0A8J7YGZ6_9EURY|nr:aldolase [Halomicroarcula salinisoli]MBX0285278.1 aldolase [Halomicroarcula salinisoli]MBX0303243.1 aldolase [Halomicroarcula salinisoli]
MRPLGDSPLVRNDKTLVLAHDHGVEHGPKQFSGVEDRLDPNHVFEMATHDAVTALAVGKGLTETYYPSYKDDVNLLAKLNGGSDLWMGDPYSAHNWSVDYAAELDVDAIGYTIYPGVNDEVEMFEAFGEVQENARDHDLPIAMWAYPRGQAVKEHRSKEIIAYAARLGLELGSDFTKVKYPRSKENMAYAVQSAADNRVLLSGGSKTSDREFLELVEDCMDVGVAGLAVGRNVWQRENPYEMLDMLEEVVFEGASADDVL